MAQFIKLHQIAGVELKTKTVSLDPIWVNVDNITGVGLETGGTRTFVSVVGGRFSVEDSPEEVMNMISRTAEKPALEKQKETERDETLNSLLVSYRFLNQKGRKEALFWVNHLTEQKYWCDVAEE